MTDFLLIIRYTSLSFARWLKANSFTLFILGPIILIGEYSLGMKKKIGLIAALVGAPPLILLDEPLTGLDAESMRHARLRIEELAARGSTFVISSHIMGFIERVCHRVAVLKQGSVVIEGHPSRLRDAAGMTEASFEDVFLHFAI